MRIDELLKNQSTEITEREYNRIKNHKIFTIEYSDEDGWEFGELNQLSEPQAKRLLHVFERVKQYERENHIKSQIHSVIVNLAAETQEPAWPEDLQGMIRLTCLMPIYAKNLTYQFNTMRLDKLLKAMKAEEKPNTPLEFWLKPVELQREKLKEMGLPISMAIEWKETNEANHATG